MTLLLCTSLCSAHFEVSHSEIDATTRTELNISDSKNNITREYEIAKSMIAKAEILANGNAYVCRGALAYDSLSFVNQAKAAAALLSAVRINGLPIVVTWDKIVNVNSLNIPWTHGGNYKDIYTNNKAAVSNALDPNNEFCVIGLETKQSLGGNNIIGLASVCGACDSNTNNHLFMVSYYTDDAYAYATILHEILHLFCAKHDSGVMRPYITPDSAMSYISESTQDLMADMQNHWSCAAVGSDYSEYNRPHNRGDNGNEERDTSIYIAIGVSGASMIVLFVTLL